MNYLIRIDLGDKGNEFARRIGVVCLSNNKYICDSITENGERCSNQSFPLDKSIDGLPANNKALEADVLKGWEKFAERYPHD